MKTRHEVRDPLYGFITFDNREKSLIDSAPFQRLRHIHQLALCYQVYPGATHRRFEHSLGVMEIASQIYDSLFNRRLKDEIQERLPEASDAEKQDYWKRVVRAAALLHDVGHLPFSHAAEGILLPPKWNHERMTAEIVRNSEIATILTDGIPPILPEDVVDVCFDASDRADIEPEVALSPWKAILNEIICGKTFGADRMDYLLRDSHHAGVAYGRFDPHRLIQGLCLIVDEGTDNVVIGLEYGAIHAAEALLLARYFMYTQVYFHHVRKAYDCHLADYLKLYLKGKYFPTHWREHQKHTDAEVIAAMRKSLRARDDEERTLAERIMCRSHFRKIYELTPPHKTAAPDIFGALCELVVKEFGEENFRFPQYGPKREEIDFPVLSDSEEVLSSRMVSGVIEHLPPIEIGLILAKQDIRQEAKKRIDEKVREMIDVSEA